MQFSAVKYYSGNEDINYYLDQVSVVIIFITDFSAILLDSSWEEVPLNVLGVVLIVEKYYCVHGNMKECIGKMPRVIIFYFILFWLIQETAAEKGFVECNKVFFWGGGVTELYWVHEDIKKGCWFITFLFKFFWGLSFSDIWKYNIS